MSTHPSFLLHQHLMSASCINISADVCQLVQFGEGLKLKRMNLSVHGTIDVKL